MNFYLSIPFLFFKFWYLEAPLKIINYFTSLNHSALEFLSIQLLVKTFFKPLKNEYRKGLVGFSIGMGIIIKSFLIIAGLIILGLLIMIELISLIAFLFWPIFTFIILFI